MVHGLRRQELFGFSNRALLMMVPLAVLACGSILMTWIVRPHSRSIVLLTASLLFCAYVDPIGLVPLISCSTVGYWAVRRLSDTRQASRRTVLNIAIAANVLLLLGGWKLRALLAADGVPYGGASQGAYAVGSGFIFIGLSFYSLQTIGAVCDVYAGKVRGPVSFHNFLLFTSFYPKLLAGPIERLGGFLSQVVHPSLTCGYALKKGGWTVLWGLFLKLVIADPTASVLARFLDATDTTGVGAFLITLYGYGIWIYADFAGYSYIAVGVALLCGIQLTFNFRFPLFASNPKDFWRTWHVSLSTWFRDYVYIPLGGNRRTQLRTSLNILATMLIAGTWHGTSLRFMLWGIYHAMLCILYKELSRIAERRLRPVDSATNHAPVTSSRTMRVLTTAGFYSLVCTGWIFFWPQLGHILYSPLPVVSQLQILASDWTLHIGLAYLLVLVPEGIARKRDSLVPLMAMSTFGRTLIIFLVLTAILKAFVHQIVPSTFMYGQF